MSQEAVEIVRALQPPEGAELTVLFARSADPAAVDAALASLGRKLTDDFVCGAQALGYGERRGAHGLRDVWLDWLEPWESYVTAEKEFIDLGDRVLVLVRDWGRRRGMSEEVSIEGAALYTVRDGKVSRIEFYAQRADAYEAAGLEP